MSRSSRVTVVMLALILSVTLGACSSPTAPPETADPAVPTEVADPDRVLVEQKCSMCHTTQKVFAMEGDVAKWNGIVDRMKKNGLVISDEERTRIIDYLSTK